MGRPRKPRFEKYDKLFLIGEKTARKFFGTYHSLLLADSIDVDDLISEVKLEIINTIKKYDRLKPIKDVCKLANFRVKTLLMNIRRNATYPNKTFYHGELSQFIPIDNNSSTSPFKFTDLMKICTDKEYELLKMLFIEQKTLEKAGKELKMTNKLSIRPIKS